MKVKGDLLRLPGGTNVKKASGIPAGLETHGGSSFPCPVCGHGVTSVTDSRPSRTTVRRRRVCRSCEARFTTFEIVADENPVGALARAARAAKALLSAVTAAGGDPDHLEN